MFLGMIIFQIQFKLLLGNFKEFLNGNGGKKRLAKTMAMLRLHFCVLFLTKYSIKYIWRHQCRINK